MKKSPLSLFQILIALTFLIWSFTALGQDSLSDTLQTQLVGLASRGGASGVGTIFKINVDDNNLSVIHNFDGTNGGNPNGALIRTSDGLLYGLTTRGGTSNYGTMFKIKTDGSDHEVLFNFNNVIGQYTYGSLLQASNGLFYGMTEGGGEEGFGTVFKINPDGTDYTILHNFGQEGGGWARNTLMQAADGWLYGLTMTDGGTIFKIKMDGSGYELLRADMGISYGPVIQVADGSLLGMSQIEGGMNGTTGFGVIFKINTDGSNYSIIHRFNGPTLWFPLGSLTQAPNGALYGSTYLGGASGAGSIFTINADGSDYKELHSFSGQDGSFPIANTLVYYHHKLFGTTTFGGQYDGGVVYNFDLPTSTYHKMVDLNDATGKYAQNGGLLLINPHPEHPANRPIVPASNISFSNVFSTSMTVSFTPGNGTGRLVLMRPGALPALIPVDNTTYSGDLGHSEMVVSNGAEHTIDINGLQPYRTYFFTVYEYTTDSLGTVRYLVNDAPAAVQRTRLLPDVYLVKPGNGTSNQYVRLTLKAKPVTDATTYTFEISTDANFIHPRIFISDSINQGIDSLQYNTKYYARLKTNLRPDYGKVTTFSTRTAESLAYVTSPANGAVNIKTSTAIASNNVPYASEYTIQLSETADFATVALEHTAPTRIMHFTGLKYGTTYYSRVRVNLSEQFGAVKYFRTQDAAFSPRMAIQQTESRVACLAVKVYQNPFSDKLTFTVESEQDKNVSITLLNLNNQPLHESLVKTNSVADLEAPFPNGVYILKVDDGVTMKVVRVVKLQ